MPDSIISTPLAQPPRLTPPERAAHQISDFYRNIEPSCLAQSPTATGQSHRDLRLPIGELRVLSQLEDLSDDIKGNISEKLDSQSVAALQLTSKSMHKPRQMASHLLFAPNQPGIQTLIATPNNEFKGRNKIKFPSTITDNQLKQLVEKGYLVHVRQLDLSGCHQITDAGLAHLKDLSQLQSLDLAWCDQITGVGLEDLKQLQSLNLFWCDQITDAGLAHLKDLTQLQSLGLYQCDQITDAGLAHLKDLTQLQSLDLNQCTQITDAGLAHLKDLKQLQSLNLYGCRQITDAGLEHLKDLKQLQSLDLYECRQITDAGLKHLKDLTQLQSLDLTLCQEITGAGLVQLKDLKQLQITN